MEVAAAAYIVMDYLVKNKRKKDRRWWQLQLYSNRSHADNLLCDLKYQSVSGLYKNFTRMSPVDFEYLINMIGPKISRLDTNWRKAISVSFSPFLSVKMIINSSFSFYTHHLSYSFQHLVHSRHRFCLFCYSI